MARPKGSKNKAKVLDGVDYAHRSLRRILLQNLSLKKLQRSARILPR